MSEPKRKNRARIFTALNILMLLMVFIGDTLWAKPYYAFDMPWDLSLSENLTHQFGFDELNQSIVYPLSINNEKFYDKNNNEVRYWGVSVTVSKNFPPKSKVDIDKVVNKMSQFGFNLVRINGIDFPAYGLYKKWYKTKELDPRLMESLDYFVYALKRKGIAYSFSINNSSLKGGVIDGVEKNLHPVKHKAFKYIQLFDPTFIDVVKEWHRKFYSHVNKYTKISYAKDDLNLYVTIVGEDSLLNAYMRGNGKYLSEKNISLLQKQFNQFLKNKYKTQNKLEEAWGVKFSPSLFSSGQSVDDGTIVLNNYNEFSVINSTNKADILQFLVEEDTKYGESILNSLVTTGFKGGIAYTNDWYGYGALLSNEKIGNMLDFHGYFDPMMMSKFDGKRYELVRNISYIDLLSRPDFYRYKDFDKNLKIFFSSSVSGYPIIISEWNHSLWSRYLYEGPVLMAVLASLQGYSGIVAHTYFSTQKNGYKKSHSNNSLLLQGNPTFMALSPALSMIYRRSLIPEFENLYQPVVAGKLYDFIANDGLDFKEKIHDEIFINGLLKKVRIKLDDDRHSTDFAVPGRDSINADALISNGSLFLENEEVSIIAGKLKSSQKSSIVTYSGKDVGDERGVIISVSLDGKKMSETSGLFITVLSDFHNTGQKIESMGKYRRWDSVSAILDYGSSPTLLKSLKGELMVKISHNDNIRLFGVNNQGEAESIDYEERISNNVRYIVVGLKSLHTPWIMVNRKSK